MTQDQPSRLDRIESALESMQQRMDAHFDQQMQLNAAFRTDLEVLRTATVNLVQAVELMQDDIQIIAQALRQHRGDGHGHE